MPTTNRLTLIQRGWRFGSFLGALAAVLLILAVFVSVEVRSNLQRLNSASSDNIQWTLSQIEVEMLELTNALTLAVSQDDPDLEFIRQEFDILYSRVQTLHGAPNYANISDFEPFRVSRLAAQRFLDETVELMDGPDEALRAALPDLHDRAQDLRHDIRRLAVVGLGRFAEQSDRRRAEVSDTLVRLAGLAIMLLAALTALIFYMLSVIRKARARGKALSQANKRMNTILTTSLDGVIVADQRGRILEINSVAQKVFGLPPEQARRHRLADLFLSDDLRLLSSKRRNSGDTAAQQDIPLIGQGRVELEAIRANGEVFPAEISIQSASDGGQELFIAFLRDISQRSADESELVEARDRALAGEKAKAEFLTVMSHEIRTPLNGLLGNLSLLEETDTSTEQSQFIRNMEISGKVLMRHVDSVLDVARFEAGITKLQSSPTDISRLVQNVIDGQLGAAEKQNATLDWRWVGPVAQWVSINPAALEQVLLNLLGNAIKFTPGGQITIEVEAVSNKPGTVSALEFRVIDTGVGIPDQDLEVVFQDFVTRDASFGRITGGTGLGLGIALRIVESMGGEIGVESTEGLGSVFWFQIPAEAVAPPAEGTAQEAPRPVAEKLDVLLVEDNEINRDVASEMLRREGHAVTCQPDGISGVESADSHPFDLILMDISMPGMDGCQATEQIRQGNGASRDAPIIAFSANVLPGDREKIERAGMNGFLSKPLRRDRLADLLRQVANGQITSQPPTPPALQSIDRAHLDSTRDSLGEDAFAALFARFEAEITQTLDTLADTLPSADTLPEIQTACHKAASSVAVFGASKLHGALLSIEATARAGEVAETTALVSTLPEIWSDTQRALNSAIAKQ